MFYFTLSSPLLLMAEDEQPTNGDVVDYKYFSLDPDIVTNYDKSGRRLGYIRLSIELLTNSAANFKIVEKNAPLIRDRIITIMGEQSEKEIKSITERDIIRMRCLLEVNEVISVVTGVRPVQDLHFTTFLYQ